MVQPMTHQTDLLNHNGSKNKTPVNEIDAFRKKADKIYRSNVYNYKYTYWIKTPNGMRLDDETNHKYGETREGYEKWKHEQRDLIAGYGGKVSLREITHRTLNGHVVGYITEEKLSDQGWLSEIEELVEQCFDKLCEELQVEDTETFEYFIYTDVGIHKDRNGTLKAKLQIMNEVYEDYFDDPQYKALIDKIKI